VKYLARVNLLASTARRHGFALLVVAVAAWVQIDLVRHESKWDPALAAAALLLPLPLLLRARAPFVAPALVVLGAVALAARDADVSYDVFSQFFAVLLAAFVVAQHPDRRLALAGLGTILVGLVYVVLGFPDETLGDFFWLSVFSTAIWLAGFVVSERSQEAAWARERARRLEAARDDEARRAVEHERQRIAGELHDVVAHALSEMTVQAGGVRRLLRDDQEREREALRTIETTGRQALVEMRRMLGILRPVGEPGVAPLAPQPGMASLAALIGRVREGGLTVDYRVKGEPVALPPGIDVSAYRVVQEALEGAGRGAARVEVRWGREAVDLEVSSDGARTNGANVALAGLRERVELCGGRLDDGPRSGGGYVVRARLPVREAVAVE
jgi:signal transduction histidine kinase